MQCKDCNKDFPEVDLNDGQCRSCSIQENKRWMDELEKAVEGDSLQDVLDDLYKAGD